MLKYLFLAGSVVLAAPVLAQTAPAQDMTSPQPVQQTAPDAVDTTPVAPNAPVQAAPQGPSAAPTTNAAPPAAVTDTVSRDFPTFDADHNGALNGSEFATWMLKLRAAAEPSFNATGPEATQWAQSTFAYADTDKSGSVSAVEMAALWAPKPATAPQAGAAEPQPAAPDAAAPDAEGPADDGAATQPDATQPDATQPQ